MINWKPIDKNKPPEGQNLFYYDGVAYTGWVIDENDDELKDDEGYPVWEDNGNLLGRAYEVRYYADFNYPVPKLEKGETN